MGKEIPDGVPADVMDAFAVFKTVDERIGQVQFVIHNEPLDIPLCLRLQGDFDLSLVIEGPIVGTVV
jgi:hypothetical protein